MTRLASAGLNGPGFSGGSDYRFPTSSLRATVRTHQAAAVRSARLSTISPANRPHSSPALRRSWWYTSRALPSAIETSPRHEPFRQSRPKPSGRGRRDVHRQPEGSAHRRGEIGHPSGLHLSRCNLHGARCWTAGAGVPAPAQTPFHTPVVATPTSSARSTTQEASFCHHPGWWPGRAISLPHARDERERAETKPTGRI